MIWLLCGGIPLLIFGIKAFVKDPKGWLYAYGLVLLIVGLLVMTLYGAHQVGWLPS
jgi:hypothetical protein